MEGGALGTPLLDPSSPRGGPAEGGASPSTHGPAGVYAVGMTHHHDTSSGEMPPNAVAVPVATYPRNIMGGGSGSGSGPGGYPVLHVQQQQQQQQQHGSSRDAQWHVEDEAYTLLEEPYCKRGSVIVTLVVDLLLPLAVAGVGCFASVAALTDLANTNGARA